MPRRERSIPCRTPHQLWPVRLCVEPLDRRDVPALLGLTLPTLPTLPVSVGLDVPVVSQLIDLDVGGNVGPLSVNVATAPAAVPAAPAEPAPPTGGRDVFLDRLVSLDVGLPLGTPDSVVTPPVELPSGGASPIPTITPPIVTPTTPSPNPPIATDSVPLSPVVDQPAVLLPVAPPTVNLPALAISGTTSPEVLTIPTNPTAPTTSATPAPTVSATPNATLGALPQTAPRPQTAPTEFGTPGATSGTVPVALPVDAEFATSSIESASLTPDAVVTPTSGNDGAEAATTDEHSGRALGEAGRQTEATLGAAALQTEATSAPADASPDPTTPTPTPEEPLIPPGEYPVSAAELLSRLALFDLTGVATDPLAVLDSLGAILPDAGDWLGERGWWYAAALAALYAGRKVMIARSRQLRRPFAFPA